MTERLNYGGGWHEDDDDAGHDGDYRKGREQAHTPRSYEADPDFVYEDYDTEAEDFQEKREQLDHEMDFADDDSGETDFEARFGRWRSKSYRRRQGKFKPPNRRWHRTPVFVRVTDLQGQGGG